MADVDGYNVPRSDIGGGTREGRPISVVTMTTGLPDVIRTYYKMRGYNTALLQDEIWVSVNGPSTTPPIGPCVNISVVSTWEA